MDMLYKLALVDDEDWILDGLQNAIEWDKIGFQIRMEEMRWKHCLRILRMPSSRT